MPFFKSSFLFISRILWQKVILKSLRRFKSGSLPLLLDICEEAIVALLIHEQSDLINFLTFGVSRHPVDHIQDQKQAQRLEREVQ